MKGMGRKLGYGVAWVAGMAMLLVGAGHRARGVTPVTEFQASHAGAPQKTSSGVLTLTVDPARSKVAWTLGATGHTVHGTFAIMRGTLQVNTQVNMQTSGAADSWADRQAGTQPVANGGKASGEILVSAASGESGNQSRDEKMHKEILESERYPEIIFRPDRVEGNLPVEGSFAARVHGVFVLHGAEHELTVPVEGELVADHWKGTGKFGVPYVEWGLKNPSNFFLRVSRAVDVELEMSGGVR